MVPTSKGPVPGKSSLCLDLRHTATCRRMSERVGRGVAAIMVLRTGGVVVLGGSNVLSRRPRGRRQAVSLLLKLAFLLGVGCLPPLHRRRRGL
jgi:hypothetical protein